MEKSARAIAFEILKKASADSTYSNIAIDRALSSSSLSPQDAGLLTAIVMGVTERALTLDWIIDALSHDSVQIDTETRAILRMGVYQIEYLNRIPDHAAVNETVSLAPRRSRGFVNAILRSFLRARDKDGTESLFPNAETDPVGYLSVKHSFPRELCRRFEELYGRERAERIFEIFNSPPSLTLRINTLKITREEYVKKLDSLGIAYRLSERLENAVILDRVSYFELPGADEGLFFVQDEASQICVEALGASEGETVIDTCSCPGSKSFGSAIRMNNQGRIYSFDLHKSKLSLVEKGAARLGIDIIVADVRDGRNACEELFGMADRVLCDVPCSGLGVIAKKPEIRYKDLGGIDRLPEIQKAILESSSQYVRVGGYLVYSTCTVLPAENELCVERFLASHPEFVATDFEVAGKKSSCGMLSLSPDKDNCDGFFVAKLRRIN